MCGQLKIRTMSSFKIQNSFYEIISYKTFTLEIFLERVLNDHQIVRRQLDGHLRKNIDKTLS